MPVDVSPAEKKLREARFFFEALTPLSYARTPEAPSEHFEFYLSAFLSASKSVSDKLGRVAGQTTGFKSCKRGGSRNAGVAHPAETRQRGR
jgi:hypothetical protein